MGKVFWLIAVFPTLVGFDWGTKELARTLPIGETVPVVPGWLAWIHAENPYIAFSVPIPLPLIVGFGLLALAGLAWTWWKLPGDARLRAAALAAVAAGAVGNLVDRWGDGSVTDFVRVYTEHPALAPWLVRQFGTNIWPIFNVADVALLVGVAIWMIGDATAREKLPETEDATPHAGSGSC